MFQPHEPTDSEVEDLNAAVSGHNGSPKKKAKSKSKGSKSESKNDKSPSNQNKMMEVFAGSGNLSRACRRQGMAAWEVDIARGDHYDFSNAQVANTVVDVALANDVKYCHFAPPCNTYSRARHPRARRLVQLPTTHSVM